MKTFILNLERSAKRRGDILQEVTKHDLDYEFIKGVDGLELSNADLENLCDMVEVRKYPDWLSRGMIGAALSHHKAYQKIIEENIEMACIIEDDVTLPANIKEILTAIEQNIGKNELVMLGYTDHGKTGLSLMDTVELTAGEKLMYPVNLRWLQCAAGYIITREAAQTLVPLILPLRVGSDSWGYYHELGGFETLRCVYPMRLGFTGAKSAIDFTHQNIVRAKLTKFIDDYKVPPFYRILKAMRLKGYETLFDIELVNEKSQLTK